MTVPEKLTEAIAVLAQILCQVNPSENPELLAALEKVQRSLVSLQVWSNEPVLCRLEARLSDWLKLLHRELESLQQQRQVLLEEIGQLEQLRQQLVSQLFQGLSAENREDVREDVEATLNGVFATLEQGLQQYCDALTQNLERMQTLEQQSEAKFLAYFYRLQQQLELSIAESASWSTASIAEQGWFLGIDLTAANPEVVLFFSNLKQPEDFSGHCLAKLWTPVSDSAQSWGEVLKDWGLTFNLPTEPLLSQALSEVAGFFIACSNAWHSADYERLKDSLLQRQWVAQREQIICFPRAIACILADAPVDNTILLECQPFAIELILVKLSRRSLAAPETYCQSLSYAYSTSALDSDLVCKLIYPQWLTQLTAAFPPFEVPFPQAGYPDLARRNAFIEQLQDHPLGEAMLEAARLSRQILQHQETFTSTLNGQTWGLTRQDLEQGVIAPLTEGLTEAIATLLKSLDTSDTSIEQIVTSSETLATIWHSLAPQLQEKFPQARLVLSDRHNSDERVWQGLIRFHRFLGIRD